jgi:hypothetical protein
MQFTLKVKNHSDDPHWTSGGNNHRQNQNEEMVNFNDPLKLPLDLLGVGIRRCK